MDASLEAQIQGLLSGIRSSAGDECMRTLAAHNSPLIMSQCGSKGSPVNIAQMVACVGQQVLHFLSPSHFPGSSVAHLMQCSSSAVLVAALRGSSGNNQPSGGFLVFASSCTHLLVMLFRVPQLTA